MKTECCKRVIKNGIQNRQIHFSLVLRLRSVLCVPELSELFSVLFLAMADVPELCLVPNRCGGMSLVYEGRVYKLRYTGKQKKHWRCSNDKKGCGGAIWTNLDVTPTLEKKAVLKKRSAEETKPIPAIYDEEASAASAQPSTFGHFPLFKRPLGKVIPETASTFPFRRTKAGDVFLVAECIKAYTGSNIRLLAAMQILGIDGTFKVVPQWYQQLFTIHAF
ncbi:hypothetical protein T11_1831, partial [Trichinella zimbabwensis]